MASGNRRRRSKACWESGGKAGALADLPVSDETVEDDRADDQVGLGPWAWRGEDEIDLGYQWHHSNSGPIGWGGRDPIQPSLNSSVLY